MTEGVKRTYDFASKSLYKTVTSSLSSSFLTHELIRNFPSLEFKPKHTDVIPPKVEFPGGASAGLWVMGVTHRNSKYILQSQKCV